MISKEKFNLYTVNGKRLLDETLQCFAGGGVPQISDGPNELSLRNDNDGSAFFDQLADQLGKAAVQPNEFLKVWLYVDFSDAFQKKIVDCEIFDYLFQKGFYLCISNDVPIHFVPFLNSASQSKKFIYGFIREDLFLPMKNRLDLDQSYETNIGSFTLPYASKLYAYRGQYTSGGVAALRAGDAKNNDFFNEKNIIVLHDFGEKKKRLVYTARQKKGKNETGVVDFEAPSIEEAEIGKSFFDGEGIISPSASKRIRGKKLSGNSFQIRMPYIKGMLHTVDFHKFLEDQGVDLETAQVQDAFGVMRNLKDANIIITTSVFKMWALLSKKEQKNPNKMTEYFDKVRLYNHGLYVLHTEKSYHHIKYVNLSAQMLSTLDLTKKAFDSLVADHVERADGYSVENLLDPLERSRQFAIQEQSDWMKLLLKQPAFLRDARLQKMLENYRVSRYHEIAFGRLEIEGELRFLSGDLFYFLICLLRLADKQNKNLDKLKKQCIGRGAVYIPHKPFSGEQIAMLRSPHLSRNEDVCTNVTDEKTQKKYDDYFGELSGVVFVGHDSCIPEALGGADYDGDLVLLTDDERIAQACRSGYVEVGNKAEESLPFIHIPGLEAEANVIKNGNYVVSRAIYNAFTNNIGKISNAAMKIAAVEYDPSLSKFDQMPSASFCTILTGTEIDACKKGLRPNIGNVVNYKGSETEEHRKVVNAVKNVHQLKEAFKKRNKDPNNYSYKLKATRDANGEIVLKETLDVPFPDLLLCPNDTHNVVTQLPYHWIAAFADMKEPKATDFPEDLPLLADVFPEANPESKTTDQILKAHGDVIKLYNKWIRTDDERKKGYVKNNDKIFTRLDGQYDDIDENGMRSLRQKMHHLQENIWNICANYSRAERDALYHRLFSESDTFDADSFWPFCNPNCFEREELLFRDIMALEDAQLLKNFRFEGYRLLAYILKNTPCKEEVDTLTKAEKKSTCSFEERYLQCAKKCFKYRVSKADFEKELTKLVKEDIQDTLNCNDDTQVIRMVYPPKAAYRLNSFWKIYSVRDVLTALGGDDNAE